MERELQGAGDQRQAGEQFGLLCRSGDKALDQSIVVDRGNTGEILDGIDANGDGGVMARGAGIWLLCWLD